MASLSSHMSCFTSAGSYRGATSYIELCLRSLSFGLSTVSFSGNSFSDAMFEALSSSQAARGIRHLFLSQVFLTDSVSGSWSRFESLEHCTFISDYATVSTLHAILRLKTLRHLSFGVPDLNVASAIDAMIPTNITSFHLGLDPEPGPEALLHTLAERWPRRLDNLNVCFSFHGPVESGDSFHQLLATRFAHMSIPPSNAFCSCSAVIPFKNLTKATIKSTEMFHQQEAEVLSSSLPALAHLSLEVNAQGDLDLSAFHSLTYLDFESTIGDWK
eukprot:TRINITY_DN4004_c0_g1_i1.p1 TRINITY_DN4004_c0_g1~~TRINITY_DN4004_c0_g1_i1.p1  ORF type:complete len:273 (-),score=31.44 TRINITY_DN4004_c0_g1_i1:351-1169(-)